MVGFGWDAGRHKFVDGEKARVIVSGRDDGSWGLGTALILSSLIQMPFRHGDGNGWVVAQAGSSEAGELGDKALGQGFIEGGECWQEQGGVGKSDKFGNGGLADAVGKVRADDGVAGCIDVPHASRRMTCTGKDALGGIDGLDGGAVENA